MPQKVHFDRILPYFDKNNTVAKMARKEINLKNALLSL
ncbi:hypothetical protein M2137_002150 [Parabacteroides sp. PFB2-10]|nr:hypothetical protein [Parabacteroides sp. PFB2-10]